MKKSFLILALMLRVWWPKAFMGPDAGSGIVIGTVFSSQSASVYVVVRKDDGKVVEVDVDLVEKSSWEKIDG